MVQTGNTDGLQMATLIDRHRGEIEQRWLQRVQEQVARAPGVELTHLRDGLPDYLKALAKQLSDPKDESRGAPAWATIAREHGITRVRIGFDINELVLEFIVLKQVIREVARENGLSAEGPGALLADSLEVAIAASVGAYVDARDYQAREKQAENIGFLIHELRNPLSNAVLAAAELERHATTEQLPALDKLVRNQKRLAELIDSVLLTERLEVGKIESHPVELALSQVMEPALEGARASARRKGIGFESSYDPDLRLRVDPSLTRSALQNLADNSAKYTDRGRVAISVDDRPEEVVIHFRDTCGGISPAELRTIFEPFERGSTRKSGTGLGLAIARRAVEIQGGTIQAESRDVTGCHFWITLPKRPA